MTTGCTFCEIIEGRQLARLIFANEEVVCFFPQEPDVLGHTLITSRRHYHDLRDCPASVGLAMLKAATLLSRRCESRLDSAGFNLLSANGAVAEQSIMHCHLHFLPRYFDDAFSAWPQLPGSNADLDDLAAKLRIVSV